MGNLRTQVLRTHVQPRGKIHTEFHVRRTQITHVLKIANLQLEQYTIITKLFCQIQCL